MFQYNASNERAFAKSSLTCEVCGERRGWWRQDYCYAMCKACYRQALKERKQSIVDNIEGESPMDEGGEE